MENDNIMILEVEEGKEVMCVVLGYFDVDEQEYVALMPVSEEEQDGDALIYRYDEDDEGYAVLNVIESEEEFQKACTVLDEVLREMYGDVLDEE